VVSGGGAGNEQLLSCAAGAWSILRSHNGAQNCQMLLFAPLFGGAAQRPHWQCDPIDPSIRWMPYSTRFVDWMHRAELSISAAGYNTCTDVLHTRTRAILVPNPAMSDQPPRAARLAERGLARWIDPAALTPRTLAAAICEELARPVPQHRINLRGAQATCESLERVA
jgi:predicted glycosyltransferase